VLSVIIANHSNFASPLLRSSGPPMLKYLRIAVTVLSLTACALLVALWVRSYWCVDVVSAHIGNRYRITGVSFPGAVGFAVGENRSSLPRSSLSLPTDAFLQTHELNGRKYPSRVWGMVHLDSSSSLIPIWCLVLFSAAIGVVPWMHNLRWRFSLRTLLIATALVAVGLGIVVAMHH
jgi:hypothetical protein